MIGQRIMRMLVVDDHRNTRKALAVGLAHMGVVVRTAASAAEAMLMLEQFACDVVVCDVRMPVIDGIELVGRLRVARPELRLLLMTAYDVAPDERERIAAAGAQLIIKPATAEAIVALCGAPTGTGG